MLENFIHAAASAVVHTCVQLVVAGAPCDRVASATLDERACADALRRSSTCDIPRRAPAAAAAAAAVAAVMNVLSRPTKVVRVTDRIEGFKTAYAKKCSVIARGPKNHVDRSTAIAPTSRRSSSSSLSPRGMS
jgi:hypothetical protein